MEGFFNSPIMKKVQAFGQKLGQNKFLASLQAAMMSTMGVLMVGAIFQIACAIGPMFHLFENGDAIYNTLYMPYHYTMDLLSLWVVMMMAFNYAKALKLKSPIINAADATVCFLIGTGAFTVTEKGTSVLNMTFLGASGMFVGFVVVFIVIRIAKLCVDKDIRIKMPDVCPPFLVDGFSAIVPLFINVSIFMIISTGLASISGGQLNLASALMAILSAPLSALVSVPGMFIIGIFATLLWCFGIHGTMIVYPAIMPMMMQAMAENGAHAAAGEPLVFFPVALFTAIQTCGGTGNTWALALMGLRSKSKQIQAVSKVSVVPGWFGVNEPLTFGMPIMYNPILCIPFVLNVPVVMAFQLILFKIGFMSPGYIPIMTLMPLGFGAYLSTLRWQNALAHYLCMIPSAIIYYPFFKIYEKQLVAKEQAALNNG